MRYTLAYMAFFFAASVTHAGSSPEVSPGSENLATSDRYAIPTWED